MKRRRFIETALAVATVARLSFRTFAAEPPSLPAARLRIGFLGVSHTHAAGKIQVVQESADWQLVGICEADEGLQARYRKAGAAVLPQEELFKQSQVVAVESDVKDHARRALLALKAGKDVHLEKPPATTLEDFIELLAVSRDKKLLLQMGYMWRYHPGINAALEAARNGSF
jgi:predicted dehydrogenase